MQRGKTAFTHAAENKSAQFAVRLQLLLEAKADCTDNVVAYKNKGEREIEKEREREREKDR